VCFRPDTVKNRGGRRVKKRKWGRKIGTGFHLATNAGKIMITGGWTRNTGPVGDIFFEGGKKE